MVVHTFDPKRASLWVELMQPVPSLTRVNGLGVSIDGSPPVSLGDKPATITVSPGQHHLRIGFFNLRRGFADIDVVARNEPVHVYYHAPHNLVRDDGYVSLQPPPAQGTETRSSTIVIALVLAGFAIAVLMIAAIAIAILVLR